MRACAPVPILRFSSLVLAAGLALSLGPPGRAGGAQEPPQATFPASVDIITVDAVVLDADNRPVGGLTQDDFRVFEDNRPQDVVRFEAFAQEPAAEPSGVPFAVSSNEAEAPQAARAFVIVLDDLRIDPARAIAARQAAESFLDHSLRDGDEVVLGTTSGDAWWTARMPEGREDLRAVLARVKGRYVVSSALDRITEYEAFWIRSHEDSPAQAPLQPDRPGSAPAAAPTPDPNQAGGSVKERVKQRWKDLNLCTGTSCDGMVRERAADVDGQRRVRTGATLEVVRRGLEAVAAVRGRKSLLLLSEGFVDDPGTDRRAVLAASREANVAVYFVNVRGLVALSDVGSAADPEQYATARERATAAFEDTVLESAGAEALAADTGGFSVKNTNDLAAGVERIAAESRVFYLLGLHPLPGKSARDWRKLRVEVKKPGLTVRARRGYALAQGPGSGKAASRGRKEGKESTLDPVVRGVLDSAHDATDIPLRVIAYVFEPLRKDATRVVVAAEFEAGGARAVGKGGVPAEKLELSIVATERDTGREVRFDEMVGLQGTKAGGSAWHAVARELDLPAGVEQVRVVARDPASGTLGSVTQRFEVPAGTAFRLSTPVLTDRMEPANGGERSRPRPALCAHREFKASGSLYLQFEVFGASRARGAPQVSAGLTLRTSDGRVARHAPSTPIAADSDGRLVRFVGFGVDGLEPGPYELSLEARDVVTGERLEHDEPLTLTRDASAR